MRAAARILLLLLGCTGIALAAKKAIRIRKTRRTSSILAVRGLVETKTVDRAARDYEAVDRLERFEPSAAETARFKKEAGLR